MKNIDHRNKDVYLILLRSITILHQYILAIGVTPTVLVLANTTTDVIIEHCKKKEKIGDIFKIYPVFYEGIASKSLLTAFIADCLTTKMGWESGTTKKKMALASILQDISLPDEAMAKINYKNSPILQNYSEAEQEDFFNHPIKAAEVARQFTTYPDLDYIVENQHEIPGRKGFPHRPDNTKLTSMSCLFNIAQFIAAELDGSEITNPVIVKILKSMSRDYNAGNFKDPLKLAKVYIRLGQPKPL